MFHPGDQPNAWTLSHPSLRIGEPYDSFEYFIKKLMQGEESTFKYEIRVVQPDNSSRWIQTLARIF